MASPPFASTNPGPGPKSPPHTSPDRMQDTTSNGGSASAPTMTAAPSALPSTTAPGKNSNNATTSSDVSKETAEASANPAEVLKTGFSLSRSEDGPAQPSQSSPPQPSINTQPTEPEKSEGRHPGLGGLPSIATAASAMQIDTDTSPTTPARGGNTASDGGITAGPAFMLHTPLSAHPMSADAVTPTTPGFPMSATTPTTPYTPSSLHTPLTPGGGRSKHTCTHCNQTFTRHHNLKSHLLTHSHEKPFPCQQCNARFRRLHDLKRHSKLHTGERPHMCDKCGRRFARGDALARHARGEGGCAGRRNSLGGLLDGDTKMFGDGTDGDDDGMMDEDTQMENGSDTVTPSVDVSSAPAPDTPISVPSVSSTSSGARRPASLPSIKTNVADAHSGNHLHPHHQPQIHQIHPLQYPTYPPMTPARSAASTGPPTGGNLFPPTPNHGKATPISASSSPNVLTSRRATSPMSGVTGNNTSSIIGAGGMTESPRPLSPAQQVDAVSRAKSPLGQFPSTGAKYAPPMTPQSAQPQNAPTSFATGGTSHTTHSRQAPTSQPSQTPSNSTQPGQGNAPQAPMGFPPKGNSPAGGGNENPNLFENERGVWDYIKDLERRVAELEAKQKGCDAFIAQAHQQSLAVAAVAAARSGTTTTTTTGIVQGSGGSGNTQGGGAAAP